MYELAANEIAKISENKLISSPIVTDVAGAQTPDNAASLINFQQLMKTESSKVVENVQKTEISNKSFGDKVLNSMHNLNTEFTNSMASMEESVMKVDITPHDIMKTQLEVMKFGLQNELVNKIVGKTTQNLDSMIKSQ